ncbi:hypothetical protein HYY70_06205, partial [Candidatus Woesearchaeota archaeon]|nr:hypothetical protein [Candidatus Woesearchaeota archaeon]
MTDLSRRVLLIGVGATGTLVATGIDSLVLGITQSEAAPATKRRITFEQARSDPKKFAADYVRQLLEEMYGKDEVKKYVHNVKFFATREDYFQEYPTLEKTDAMESNLVTNYEGSKFGKKAKSEIIVFPELFTHNRELKIGNRTISVEPTEEIIKAYLRHEFKHAQDNYHGIKLKGGNEISSTDYGRINFEVYKFIKESRGCVEEMAYIMASEKVNPMTLVLRKI